MLIELEERCYVIDYFGFLISLKTVALQNSQKLKEAEKQRINKLEELDNKANIQLERQLVMASYWSRVLLTLRGKLKGTEWDPENSHRINYSDFLRLLNSNNVQFMEYSNYGQTISGREFLLHWSCIF